MFNVKDATFAKLLVAGFAAASVAMASYNLVVNPFDVFPTKPIAGVSEKHAISNARLYKTFTLRHGQYDGLLLGSSRIEESMNPVGPAWEGMTPYNMAMPGASIYEMQRNLQHAHAITPLKQVVIGLDFFMFNAFRQYPSDFSEDYFSVEPDGSRKWPGYVIRTYTNVLLSYDGFEKSRQTHKLNQGKGLASHEANGMTSIETHQRVTSTNEAIYQLFDSFENNYFRKNSFWLNGPNASYVTKNQTTGVDSYQQLRELLNVIYQHDINAHLVISPIHGRFLMALDGIGLWPKFQDFKRQLTLVNEEVAKAHGKPPRPLWDFAQVNELTTELLPDDKRLPEPRRGMHWFWDPAHPHIHFGELIQQAMFISQDEQYGNKLNSQMIEQHLSKQSEKLQQYMQDDQVNAKQVKERLKRLGVWQWVQE